MHHLRALISQSPEELPEAFFKQLKKYNSDFKVKVWSRKDPMPGDYDYYFFSHRDFVYLKKLHQLPLSKKIILLATSLNIESASNEAFNDKICCFVSGNEEARGRLAADYFVNICKMSQGLLPVEVETQTNTDFLDRIKISPWMKKTIQNCLLELLAWNSEHELKFNVQEEDDMILILASVHGEVPSLDLFCHTFHHSNLPHFNQETLKILTLKSLFH
jgi:hypothetical protein